jgi:protocatechuate 3,4-dioxygenase beta subunit
MRQQATSAKDGTFVLDGVPDGRLTLSVYAPDHGDRELDVVVNEATGPLEIALSAGGTLAGRLTAADGVTPVAGAIGLFNLDEGFGSTRRSGPAGEFSYEHLAPGRYQLTGHAQDGNVSREIVLARNQHIEGIVLALGVGRAIRGVVRGLNADDLKHLAISLRTDDAAGSPYSEVRVDERGGYVLRGVKPGRAQVVAEVTMRRQLVKTVDVPPDSDVTLDFDFPAGARLSGRVTHGGQPVARVWISPRPAVEQPIYNYGTATSNDGTYAIENLANGEYVLFVGDFKSKPVQVSGDTVFDVDVPLAQLAGRILEEGGKAPVVGAVVEIWPTEPDPSRSRRGDRSDHFGQFGLAGLEPGQYLLTAYKPGYEMFRRQIAYEKPVPDMTIRLQQDPGVEIRVRAADTGKPVSEIYVIELIGERNGSRLVVPLDAEGAGYIPSALEGSKLSFAASGFAQAIVESWSGQQLDLKLVRERPQG